MNEASVAEGIGLAHDAGNLLGAIRLYCDLLALPGVLRSEHRHYAEELQQLSIRSGSLIGRFLGVPQAPSAQGAQQRAHVAAETTRPADVVVACRGLLHTIVGAGALSIEVEAGGDAEVAVRREAMERILVNLTKNAVEAREGDGTVTIRVGPALDGRGRSGVTFSVEDRGRGMSESKARSLLSGEASGVPDEAGARPGRGIGLRVVRELVAETGGELAIRSRVGRGTTVEIVWTAVAREGSESG